MLSGSWCKKIFEIFCEQTHPEAQLMNWWSWREEGLVLESFVKLRSSVWHWSFPPCSAALRTFACYSSWTGYVAWSSRFLPSTRLSIWAVMTFFLGLVIWLGATAKNVARGKTLFTTWHSLPEMELSEEVFWFNAVQLKVLNPYCSAEVRFST